MKIFEEGLVCPGTQQVQRPRGGGSVPEVSAQLERRPVGWSKVSEGRVGGIPGFQDWILGNPGARGELAP